jgi:hypothetical protein
LLGSIAAIEAGESAEEREEGVMVRGLLRAGALVLVVLPTACSVTVQVIVADAGRGTVTGGGLSCRGISATTIGNPSVTLTVTADSDSTLVGWAGRAAARELRPPAP